MQDYQAASARYTALREPDVAVCHNLAFNAEGAIVDPWLLGSPDEMGALCAYLALRLVEGRRVERAVASSPGLRTNLSWLGFARPLARYAGEGARNF